MNKSPRICKSLPTHKFAPIPTPPTICNAPVCVLVASVALVIRNALLISPPLKLFNVDVVTICAPLIKPLVCTYKLFTPTPPVTCNALPEMLVVVNNALLTTTVAVVVAPRLVTESNVLTFHTVMSPAPAVIAVSVPAVILVTPVLTMFTLPVDALALRPAPTVICVTPTFVIVSVATGPVSCASYVLACHY